MEAAVVVEAQPCGGEQWQQQSPGDIKYSGTVSVGAVGVIQVINQYAAITNGFLQVNQHYY